MFSCLLKRVLPFALTLTVGATLGWLFNFQGAGRQFTVLEQQHTPLGGYGYGRSCRMYRRNLVAETKPLVILFKPDARLPRRPVPSEEDISSVHVLVTFGADGKVQQVEPYNDTLVRVRQDLGFTSKDFKETPVWVAVERAARQIQFEPETINGIPVSVTKDVEIHFMAD
jgi:hypothetical protein